MRPIYRIIGKRGNTTIPYALRVRLGISSHDLISYACDGESITVRKEKLCDGCSNAVCSVDYSDSEELKALLAALPEKAKREALVYLSVHVAKGEKGAVNAE